MMHAADAGDGCPDDQQEAPPDLAQTLVTRLCHDLAGMIGTLSGALEMIDEDPAAAEEALPIATEAAIALNRRLRVLRAAWGAPGDGFGVAELRDLAGGMAHGRRSTIDLDGLSPDRRFSSKAGQLLLNILILGLESVYGAGVVSAEGGASGDVLIRLSGPRAAWPDGFGLLLADPDAAEAAARTSAPRTVLSALTALTAHRSGLRASLLLGAEPESAAPVLLSMD